MVLIDKQKAEIETFKSFKLPFHFVNSQGYIHFNAEYQKILKIE